MISILLKNFMVIVERFSETGQCIIARTQSCIQNPVKDLTDLKYVYFVYLSSITLLCGLKAFTEDLNEYLSLEKLVYC